MPDARPIPDHRTLMLATPQAPQRARWEVIFVHRGKLLRKQFDADLGGALAYYVKALSKPALKLVTLRCKNMAFPPPLKLQPHSRAVKHKGKTRTVQVNPLRTLNLRGVWWCPLCIKLRKFVQRKRDGEVLYCCPACGVSHKSFSVAQFNPVVWEKLTGRQ